MFRSRRSNLGKRLWKARIRSRHEAGREAKDWETLLRSGLLKEPQLEQLLTAVETRDSSTCVLLPRNNIQDPHLLCCQIWRWPDLRYTSDLKRIPVVCHYVENSMDICCNPYHWSRLCKPEAPPPPYCRFNEERLKPEDRAPSEGNCCGRQQSDQEPAQERLELRGSLATNGEGESHSKEWCRLAYWELSNRIGRQYSVETDAINVFWNVPHGNGLCLASLAQHSFSPPDTVKKAREKIGRGLTLSLESDGVWAYNRSDSPMFVNSPALDDPDSRTILVYRVPPGHCLNVFVPGAPVRKWDPYINGSTGPIGPVDPNSVRISFVKGWGPKYTRQEVTACPTWLEVLLAPCR